MKVTTFLGTRPEIIRLSRLIPLLDRHCQHVVVHTGQNSDPRLSGIFFDELGVRPPDHFFGIDAQAFGAQVGQILERSEKLLLEDRPDAVLVLGDTNSGLVAIVAKRLGIPVFHMEAGNRCFDDRVPEEVNRRIIDHCSTVLLPYTHRAKENLVREGAPIARIYVTGNPILEVLRYYEPQITASRVLERFGLKSQGYFLVTLHRAENVDVPERLEAHFDALRTLARDRGQPVLVSLHPRTRSQLERSGLGLKHEGITLTPPLGLFDFVRLERDAACVLTDSGTVQEECCIFGVPAVTLRDVTERPETIEVGSNILAGADTETIRRAVDIVTSRRGVWTPPSEYLATSVSETVARIVLGYHWPGI